MNYPIDETHDPSLESWVESANDPASDFPIQNLPWCMYEVNEEDAPEDPWTSPTHVGVVIGDQLLSLTGCARLGLLEEVPASFHELDYRDLFEPDIVFPLLSMTPQQRKDVRNAISQLLRADGPLGAGKKYRELDICHDPSRVEFYPNMEVGNYTDFYASVFHATNVGSMFRPDNPLLPNYKWIPVGYHGLASSLVLSGTPVRRPSGQQSPAEEGGSPAFGPCKMLDYELEVGAVIGTGNRLGEPISLEEAEDAIAGLCLVNDWSARDIQKWEYVPLGPFLAKSFATSISPYLVTMESLAPFRCPAQERASGDPAPLPYLQTDQNRTAGGIDITLEVFLQSAQMRDRGLEPMKLSRGSFRDMYWTLGQMVTHHTVNGCNLQPGDLLASGTISGPTRDSRGCLLELTWDGDPWANPPVKAPTTQRTPIALPTGEERKFLAGGDEIVIRGFCERNGYRRIGFGECRGRVE